MKIKLLIITAIIMLSACTASPSPTTPIVKSEPIVLTGKGSATSAPFITTTDEWIIDWSYTPNEADSDLAVFSFFVYHKGETKNFVKQVLLPKETTGSTYCYLGKGEYYIRVVADNVDRWEIKISSP